MKVVGNKRRMRLKSSFLRYSICESGMISGLFFWRPIENFLFCRYAIMLKIPGGLAAPLPAPMISGNFPEISGKFLRKISQKNFTEKFPRNFSEISRKFPDTPTNDGVCGNTPLELQIQFSRNDNFHLFVDFFPSTFKYNITTEAYEWTPLPEPHHGIRSDTNW